MIYSETSLTKQGSPLAHVWLVGSLDKKLTRREINSTDILKSVRIIRDNEGGTFALRLEGQLLLGVSRIYNTKVKNLETDCTVAFSELKAAFKPGNVNLPGSTDILSLLPEDNGITRNRQRSRTAVIIQNNASGESRSLLQNTLTDFTDLLPAFPMELSGDILSQASGTHNGPGNTNRFRDDDFNSAPSQFTQEVADTFDQSIEIGRRRGGLDEDEDEDEQNTRILADDDDENELNLDLDLDLDKEIEIGRGEEELPSFNLGADDDDGEMPPMIPDEEEGFGNVSANSPGINNPATPTGNELDEMIDIGVEDNANSKSVATAALLGDVNPKRKRALRDQTTTIVGPRADSRVQASQSQADRDEAIESILTDHPVLPNNSIAYGLLCLSDNHNQLLDSVFNQYSNPLLDIRSIAELLKKKADMESGRAEEGDATLQQIDFENDFGMSIVPGGDEDEEEGPNQKALRVDEEGNRAELVLDDEDGFPIVSEPLYNLDLEEEEEEDFFGTSFFGPSTQPENGEENQQPQSSQSNNRGVSRNTIIAAQKLRQGLEFEESISFSELSEGGRKSDKVKMFFEMLVLATKDAISIDQPAAFGDFNISAKPKLHNPIWDEPEQQEDATASLPAGIAV
ncbi:Double-strand-break repair protein rad21-like protein 1 [Sugiyamaella lignohabitans]|uniref:Double-strand-break repair protein rad21-like protein 1 n=1 Tax=Sugiyamaella lignohabitans TaxID=796027 RepID=A0A167EFK5_9ASCO|nr:Double-strand-break repair protein rad21-like protein 1 [Sugiyamaella lignohabitans]ANB14018.1 Double-strand-break repair protein rad21-like protein 1 [Sugiyamaella lignohabitans]